MTFDQDAKLFDVLAGGYHLNTQLQALLGRPLDRLGQQEAMAFSQELSQVFKVSMSMLKRNTVTIVKTTPEISRTGNSSGVIIPAAKDKRARSDSGEVITPAKKIKEQGATRTEITASPHKDGYEWRKYGQKNIRNCNFVRHYFRCSRDRRCEAKKKVQQQDDEGGHQLLPASPSPVFEVTYVNQHTCHALRANTIANANVDAATMASPRNTNRYRVVDTARDAAAVVFDDGLSSFPGSAQENENENETIVSCLANVISGAAATSTPSTHPWPPAASAEASASDPAAAYHHHHHVPAPRMQQASGSGYSASVAEDGGSGGTTTMVMMVDTDFSWDQSLFCAVGDEGDGQLLMTDNGDRDMMMVHVDAATRLPDTVWPRHTSAGAWRWR